MPKFTARVAVHHDDGDHTWFNPGDNVPDWAIGLVGDHCIEGARSDIEAESTAESDAESEGMPPRPAAGDASKDAPKIEAPARALNFTGAPDAPKARRGKATAAKPATAKPAE
ncbi:hypothetical protein [Paeniglutamicibacter terrestris]|uniref:Uncharacterized protein n=1 Tax=Paeniglutamicibacter terrestris TaxID=2723403 RepID=A0ABX1G4F2_9MICC|nr:hypothetical protein [Paeniglutamicibacter terrestris]NKG21104.1 hypothetical protein [Paeniglutamicibacter terrestris]